MPLSGDEFTVEPLQTARNPSGWAPRRHIHRHPRDCTGLARFAATIVYPRSTMKYSQPPDLSGLRCFMCRGGYRHYVTLWYPSQGPAMGG